MNNKILSQQLLKIASTGDRNDLLRILDLFVESSDIVSLRVIVKQFFQDSPDELLRKIVHESGLIALKEYNQ